MKKKILVKEKDLENLVKSVIKENEQLEIDFPEEKFDDSILNLLYEKYNETIGGLNNVVESCGDLNNEECYQQIENLYETMFEVYRSIDTLHTINASTREEKIMNLMMSRFNDLENRLVDYLETYKEFHKMNQTFEESKMGLIGLRKIKKG